MQAAAEGLVDFQPDVTHQVIPENKRRKKLFEKLYLEGRPPLNVGVTSSGDFFGGTQVALTDVLGDQNFTFTVLSVREFRTYEGTYINLRRRLHYGITGFDYTRFFYADPYGLADGFAFREGALATQRYTGGQLVAAVPARQVPADRLLGGGRAPAARATRTRKPRPSSARRPRRRA